MAPPPIPPPTAYGTTTRTAAPLYWCTYGSPGAPRMLVLHGGPGAHHDYLLPQMLELARLGGDAGRELLFYDQRGGGRSRTTDRDPITWRTHVADLARVLDELGLAGQPLVGYSWGALLAMLYASEAANDKSLPAPGSLVLLDPAPVTREFRNQFEAEFSRRLGGDEVARLRDELAKSGMRERDPEGYRQRNFELSVAPYFAEPREATNLTPFRVNSRIQQSVWESLGDFDLVADGRLALIPQPALIVHGRQDPIPLASSEHAARAMHAELVILDNCGHVPYVEQPEKLFSAVGPFLRGR